MNPGHELDALILEKVFTGDIAKADLYSTNIASAFQIFTKLKKYNPYVQYMSNMDSWAASYLLVGDLGWSFGNTPSHAICLATLKAMELINDKENGCSPLE